jgi:hypothetical protein
MGPRVSLSVEPDAGPASPSLVSLLPRPSPLPSMPHRGGQLPRACRVRFLRPRWDLRVSSEPPPAGSRREDRHLKFYELWDNLPPAPATAFDEPQQRPPQFSSSTGRGALATLVESRVPGSGEGRSHCVCASREGRSVIDAGRDHGSGRVVGCCWSPAVRPRRRHGTLESARRQPENQPHPSGDNRLDATTMTLAALCLYEDRCRPSWRLSLCGELFRRWDRCSPRSSRRSSTTPPTRNRRRCLGASCACPVIPLIVIPA